MIKYGFREFQRNIFTNLLVILQLAVTLVLTVAMLSAVENRIKLYLPLKDNLAQDGYAVMFRAGSEVFATDGSEQPIYQLSKNVTDVLTAYYPNLSISDPYTTLRSYNQRVTELYKPKMSDGVWIDHAENNTDYVCAVATYGSIYKVGDIIAGSMTAPGAELTQEMIENGNYELPRVTVNIKIIGVLKQNESLFGVSAAGTNMDYRDFYVKTANLPAGESYLVFNAAELTQHQISQMPSGLGLINIADGLTDEQIQNTQTALTKLGVLYDIRGINEASTVYVYHQLYLLLPIIICFLLLVAVSSLSLSAIYTKKQLKNFALYYLCGSRWRSCLRISLMNTLLVSLVSILLAWAFINIDNGFGLLKNTIVSFGWYQFCACAAVLVFHILVSQAMPLRIMATTTPKEIITTYE
ncbi:MAG: hypothetical protein QM689_12910 [Oscillospiraceae bacterium]